MIEDGGAAELGLAFVTVANNSSMSGNALFNDGGAITVAASILSAGASGSACRARNAPIELTTAGYNVGDDGTCDLDAPSDIADGEPVLGTLEAVPTLLGETYVHPLNVDSDAHQRVPSGVLGCGVTVAQDQRGEPRPTPGTRCDAGAYESTAATCAPPYNAADEATLQWAIAARTTPAREPIPLSWTTHIALTTGTRAFDNPAATAIILDGDGHTIDGGGNDNGRCFLSPRERPPACAM